MEKGNIKIINEEGKTPSVEAELVNGTIFLTKYEIAQLLNCFPQKVEANLRSIFKSHLLWAEECTYNSRYTDKGLEKQCVYYNMEALIFVSYRVNSFEAKIFRQFVHSALREHLQKENTPKESMKIVWLYPFKRELLVELTL
jgi:hypothetical protein